MVGGAFSAARWRSAARRQVPEAKEACRACKAAWSTSALRQSPTARAVMKLVEPARATVGAKLLAAPLAAVTIPAPTDSALQEGMAAAMFMAAAGTEAAYMERDGLPALRLTVSGTRFVVQVPVTDTCSYFRKAGVTSGGGGGPGGGGPGEQPLEADTLNKVHAGLLQASREVLADIARQCPVYFATIGPGDLSYTPPGYLTVESVHGKVGGPLTSDVAASALPHAARSVLVCATCARHRHRACAGQGARSVISGRRLQAELPHAA